MGLGGLGGGGGGGGGGGRLSQQLGEWRNQNITKCHVGMIEKQMDKIMDDEMESGLFLGLIGSMVYQADYDNCTLLHPQ